MTNNKPHTNNHHRRHVVDRSIWTNPIFRVVDLFLPFTWRVWTSCLWKRKRHREKVRTFRRNCGRCIIISPLGSYTCTFWRTASTGSPTLTLSMETSDWVWASNQIVAVLTRRFCTGGRLMRKIVRIESTKKSGKSNKNALPYSLHNMFKSLQSIRNTHQKRSS